LSTGQEQAMPKNATNGRNGKKGTNGAGLHDAFVAELRDSYDCEKQLVKTLPKLAAAAASSDLRTAFESHLVETRKHVERLEQVFQALDEKAQGKHCDGIAGIIKEGAAAMEENFSEATMDAALIAGGQRAEHYEIAAYGTLIAWAGELGHEEVVDLLEQTLEEEKAADKKLTDIAKSAVNRAAAGESGESDEADSDMRSTPARPPVRAEQGRGRSARR
jgi:ferritin-like metal-binding protein YciE